MIGLRIGLRKTGKKKIALCCSEFTCGNTGTHVSDLTLLALLLNNDFGK